MIPNTLKALPIWIVIKTKPCENGHTNKIPFSAVYNGFAKSNDPSSWCPYEIAERRLHNGFDFLGVAITEPFIFIDLDACFDDGGHISDFAREVVGMFPNSFIERSQSGRGIHIICKGKIPRAVKRAEIEIYGSGRFCTLTGDAIQEKEPEEEQASIDCLIERYVKPEPPEVERPQYKITKNDEEIISLLCRDSVASDLFHGMWEGHFPSHSEADLYLCQRLAFWCDRNPGVMDRIFSASGLYRKKWEREDYKNRTIRQAINGCAESFAEWKGGRDACERSKQKSEAMRRFNLKK